MTDRSCVILIQGLLGVLLIISIFHDIRIRLLRSGLTAEIVRGPGSRGRLISAYGFASVILNQLIAVSNAFECYKVFLCLVDTVILFYLCFYSSWFRQRIVGWISVWEARPER